MKRIVALLLSVMMVATLAAGCGAGAAGFKVGMVTDSGTIDDKSFNQGTWEGILKAKKDFNLDTNYLKPGGQTHADYTKEIQNLYDAGYKFIVTPGFKFSTAIYESQEKYKDAKFVLIDALPNNGKADAEYKEGVTSNSVSIFFAEHQSGFLAGVATALQLKEGDVGFIGGMEIPPVQKFNWGFQQGVKYANDNFKTNVTIKAENVVYEGSFDRVDAGQQLAAQMFDRGVKAIFCAAGGVGVGAINEAKQRGEAGQKVWIVGVDVDQYADGLLKDGKTSIILTSAMKKIDTAAYDMIKAQKDGKFPGGKVLTFDVKNNGVGIPANNPNLSAETIKTVNDVFTKLQKDEITVADKADGLIK
ncbi:MAG: BMP family ABC transporter substrate-binding protein [Clostridia bacterium]|nr:BMP family ABC transporter substrate-binding protein [Clostridia bacterium]